MKSETKTINTFPPISVLIPDGENYETLKVLRCLGQVHTVNTHIMSREHWPVYRLSRYCRKSHYYASQKDSDWMDTIRKIVRQWNIDVILPSTMKGIEFLSKKRKAISEFVAIAPIPEFEVLQIAQDKWSFHLFAQEQGIPVVPTILAAEGDKIIANQSELESVDYPALLKPVTGSGGKGIIKIDKPSDLYRIAEHKETFTPGKKYLLQSYIPGRDLCLGVCCKHGKILVSTIQKSLFHLDHFFGYQKAMDFVHDDRVIELGTRLVSAMAWEGVAFIDFREVERDKSLRLIEMNPRFGRGLLGALHAGINFPVILCLLSLSLEYTGQREATGRYVYPSFFISMLTSRLLGRSTPVKAGVREIGFKLLLSDPIPDIFRAISKLKSLGSFF